MSVRGVRRAFFREVSSRDESPSFLSTKEAKRVVEFAKRDGITPRERRFLHSLTRPPEPNATVYPTTQDGFDIIHRAGRRRRHG